MTNNGAANGIGFVSVACSLAFWLWACITLFTPIGHTPDYWALGVLFAIPLWITLWVLGFLLGMVAGALGSRRWFAAAMLALVSCGAAAFLASFSEW